MAKTITFPKDKKWKLTEIYAFYNDDYDEGKSVEGKDLKDDSLKVFEKWKKNNSQTQGNICVLNGRFLVAVKSKYGKVGDKLRVVLNNKKATRIDCIIAEIIDTKGTKTFGSEWGMKRDTLLGTRIAPIVWETKRKPTRRTFQDLFPIVTWLNDTNIAYVINVTQKSDVQKEVEKQVGAEKTGNKFHPSDGKTCPKLKGYYGSKNYSIFPVNYNVRFPPYGNCTWYAYGRFCEIAGKWVDIGNPIGDAVNFYDKDHFPGCSRGPEPKLGAIICWGKGSESGHAGHVAVVEQIYKNGDIRVTNAGYTDGWMGSLRLSKKSGYITVSDATQYGGGGWTWSDYVFRGFIYNPIEFDSSGVATSYTAEEEEQTQQINMQERISKLYSSSNYKWIEQENKDKEKPASIRISEAVRNYVETQVKEKEKEREKTEKRFLSLLKESLKEIIEEKIYSTSRELNRNVNSIFDLSRYSVEAPFVEVTIGGRVIGTYGHRTDKYPNYINKLDIVKTNGQINEYNIELVHQIRVGDDPALIDKLISKEQFNKITISYGDSYSGNVFKDVEAIITNVSSNRDYASASITYTINATSAGDYITCHTMNFPARTDKPSNIIRQLLYNSEISNELITAFPAMASRNFVDSKGWIPNNDAVVSFNPIKNADPVTYINYLVASMSNASDKGKLIKSSSYFIFYTDDKNNGAGFRIQEIKSEQASNKYNGVYEVTIGYPDGNNIFSFDVNNDRSWALMYDHALENTLDEYSYTIEDNGDIKKYYFPTLESTSTPLTEYQKNWWTYMTTFPISATLTMRGLFRPIMLTNYVKINVVFYGQKHITSGLYAIVEQRDSLSGNGFRTTFSLIRVGDE